jgi:hypothetical protein
VVVDGCVRAVDPAEGVRVNIFDKAKDALNSDKAEEITDKGLDAVSGAADKVTGGKFTEKIQGARDAADEKLGNDGA